MIIRELVNHAGGAERIYCELANMLAERGYQVSCLCYDHNEGEPFYPLSQRVELINLAPSWTTYPYRLGRMFTRMGSVRRLARLLSTILPARVRNELAWYRLHHGFLSQIRSYFASAKPDLAISFMPPANTPSLLAAKSTGVKVIATNHNAPAQDYLSPSRWDPNPLDRKMRLDVLHYAERIHVLFPGFGEWFPEALQPKIVAIPNYVSNDILRAKPRERRDNVILAVGRLTDVKNYGTLIKAWTLIYRDYPDWKVVVFGMGPMRSVLKAEIASLGIADSFELAGQCSNLGEEYARAAIFCHPAHFEGFSLAVAEALALKTPVVGFSDCTGLNELVVDGYNGVLVERSEGEDGLAKALKSLMDDHRLRQRLGENGRRSVESFTEDRYAAAWVDLIESILV